MSNAVEKLHRWLIQRSFPTWLEHGVDRVASAFHEHLTHGKKLCVADERRLRVACRQVYCFSYAAQNGVPAAVDAVYLGLNYLRNVAAQADGGYAWKFTLDGKVLDSRRDLYDHAFTLLALSAAHRAVPDPFIESDCNRLMSYLDENFRHPAGGYYESLSYDLLRRQNPHMHLLEACLHAAETFKDINYIHRSIELVELFYSKFYQSDLGVIPEYFSNELEVIKNDGFFAVEPGHHCEWVWLLTLYAESCRRWKLPVDPRISTTVTKLMSFVYTAGIHPKFDYLVDEVWSDGRMKSLSARLWPQTEWLKAELIVSGDCRNFNRSADSLLTLFLREELDGLWCERFDPSGLLVSEESPASSLYHLTAAIGYLKL